MIFARFRPVPIYVKIRRDQMEVLRLDTGHSVTWRSEIPFSNERLVLAHFSEAEDHLKSLLAVLFDHKWFTPRLNIVIQQMEGIEGGLSSVENRALFDLAEIAGASHVYLIHNDRELDHEEALEIAAGLKGKHTT